MRHFKPTLLFLAIVFFSRALFADENCSANQYTKDLRPSLQEIRKPSDFYNWQTFLSFRAATTAMIPLAKRAPIEGPTSLAAFDIDDRAWQYDFLSTQWSQGGCGFYQKTSAQRKANDVYNFKYWQYIDISYYFGHGLLTIPPTMWTNAAHKNGVKSLGTFNLNEVNPDELIDKTHLVQTIKTLANIANRLQFDGYLINYEGNAKPGYAQSILMLMNALKKKGLIIIWYDAPISGGFANYFNKKAVPYFVSAGYFQSNYWWDYPKGYPAKSYQTLVDNHLEKAKDNVFQSGDAYRDPFKSDPFAKCDSDPTTNLFFTRFKDIYTDSTLRSCYTGIGFYAPNWTMFGVDAQPESDTHVPSIEKFEQSDAAFWEGSGAYGCGHDDYRNAAHFVKPRTVITQLPFYSNFNTGVGESYFSKGKLLSTGPWSNFTVQSILPTWQNVMTETSRKDAEASFDYKNVYEGGASWRILANNITRSSAIFKLYKTQFTTDRNTQAQLIVKSSANEGVVLILNQIKLTPAKVTNLENSWKQLTFNLPANIDAQEIDIAVEPNNEGKINFNLGSLKIFDPGRLPVPHNQFALKFHNSLLWLPTNKSSSYRIYGQNRDGSYMLLNEAVNASYDLHGNIFNGNVDGLQFKKYLIQEMTAAGDTLPT